MRNKLFTLLSVLVLFSLLVTACGGRATPTPAAAEPTAAPAEPTAAPVEPTAAPV